MQITKSIESNADGALNENEQVSDCSCKFEKLSVSAQTLFRSTAAFLKPH